MKWHSETLQNLPYFLNKKTQILFSLGHLWCSMWWLENIYTNPEYKTRSLFGYTFSPFVCTFLRPEESPFVFLKGLERAVLNLEKKVKRTKKDRMKNETIIRVWLFLHYPIWLPTWQVKIVLVKTLEERLVTDRVYPKSDRNFIKYANMSCSTSLKTHFSMAFPKTRNNPGFGYPIRQ